MIADNESKPQTGHQIADVFEDMGVRGIRNSWSPPARQILEFWYFEGSLEPQSGRARIRATTLGCLSCVGGGKWCAWIDRQIGSVLYESHIDRRDRAGVCQRRERASRDQVVVALTCLTLSKKASFFQVLRLYHP